MGINQFRKDKKVDVTGERPGGAEARDGGYFERVESPLEVCVYGES